MYEHTYQLAALEPPTAELQALFEALRGNQEQTDRFLGTIAGTTAIAEFFSDENLKRTLGGVPSRHAA